MYVAASEYTVCQIYTCSTLQRFPIQAALATLIAQGHFGCVFTFDFFYRMRRYKSIFAWFEGQELRSMLRIAVPSVLQQSTVSIGMMIVQAVVNPFGTQALAGYAATMRVENVFP